ncbi:MAG: hypothetical protein AUJ85_02245 [Elusimicrobia bacterium CG1_02_37_114]|nr:MAG: hypothetical protein AUJ85_02245 [Elusimicrobia bacterium CG1_02_37_114]PIV53661.1 MAG: hypothetical protein COS17_02805 [Elusimicrobia bacterium CG02_land_8_20_14_3_00_37_13]
MKNIIIIRRFELIIIILVLILTGSLQIISKETSMEFPLQQRYPYCVAFTFDDGPYPVYTEKLVNLLKELNVHATFFVTGKNAERHPELIRLIDNNGHELGGHSHTPFNFTKLSNKKILYELNKTKEIIKRETNKDTCLFRPPGGHMNERVRKLIQDNGYEIIMWDVLPKDHELSTTQQMITKHILEKTKNFDIVLLHQGRQSTMDSLPETIKTLRAKGFRLVTVSEISKMESHPR